MVLGADEHTGLEVSRALHREGLRVLGGGLNPRGFGFRSRTLTARFLHPDPEADPQGFVARIHEAALRHRVKAILPSLDTALLPLHKNRARFVGVAALGIAPAEAMEIVVDKQRLYEFASAAGIEMPRSCAVEAGQGLPADFPFPAIVKQRDQGRLGPRKVIYCATRQEAEAALAVYGRTECVPIVQELVHGYGVQLIGVCRGGEILQVFQYRRVREYSCRGGLGSFTTSEPVAPALLTRAAPLLRALRWEGIVGVEFKVPENPAAAPRLIEINARFVGFMGLALSAGINFPRLQYELTVGNHVDGPPLSYRSGVRYQRWLLDTLCLIELLLDRPTLTGVPLPGRLAAVLGYLATLSPFVGGDRFKLSDPLPGLTLVARGLPVVARRLRQALRPRHA